MYLYKLKQLLCASSTITLCPLDYEQGISVLNPCNLTESNFLMNKKYSQCLRAPKV